MGRCGPRRRRWGRPGGAGRRRRRRVDGTKSPRGSTSTRRASSGTWAVRSPDPTWTVLQGDRERCSRRSTQARALASPVVLVRTHHRSRDGCAAPDHRSHFGCQRRVRATCDRRHHRPEPRCGKVHRHCNRHQVERWEQLPTDHHVGRASTQASVRSPDDRMAVSPPSSSASSRQPRPRVQTTWKGLPGCGVDRRSTTICALPQANRTRASWQVSVKTSDRVKRGGSPTRPTTSAARSGSRDTKRMARSALPPHRG